MDYLFCILQNPNYLQNDKQLAGYYKETNSQVCAPSMDKLIFSSDTRLHALYGYTLQVFFFFLGERNSPKVLLTESKLAGDQPLGLKC